MPPLFSAKRVGGERLYHLARRGQVVERAPVAVTIHALEFLGMEGPCVRLRVRCSKGTYARTLCEDIGRALVNEIAVSGLFVEPTMLGGTGNIDLGGGARYSPSAGGGAQPTDAVGHRTR